MIKIILLFVALVFSTDACMPVKQTESLEGDLEGYSDIHGKMRDWTIQYQCENLYKKLKEIDGLKKNLPLAFEKIINTIENIKQNNIENKYLYKNTAELQHIIDSLLELITGYDKYKGADNKKIDQLLSNYLNKYITTVENDYSGKDIFKKLFSALNIPKVEPYVIEHHLPNTFICAFSFILDNKKQHTFFIDNKGKIQDPKTCDPSLFFTSGDHNGDLSEFAIMKQLQYLGARVLQTEDSKKRSKYSGPHELYRHSEQAAFFTLGGNTDNMVNLVTQLSGCIEESAKISEIIFHGHTFRDMCPNCRTTLIAINTITNNKINTKQNQRVFLETIAHECDVKNQFTISPKVTCLISSSLHTEDDSSWELNQCICGSDKKTKNGIESCFVNQYRFPDHELWKRVKQNLKGKLKDDNYDSKIFESVLKSIDEKLNPLKE